MQGTDMSRSHTQYQARITNIHQHDTLLGADCHATDHTQRTRSRHLTWAESLEQPRTAGDGGKHQP